MGCLESAKVPAGTDATAGWGSGRVSSGVAQEVGHGTPQLDARFADYRPKRGYRTSQGAMAVAANLEGRP